MRADTSDPRPLSSVGEENLLHLDGDRYTGESIMVHEFAHSLFTTGNASLPNGPTDTHTLATLYASAQTAGTWDETYAMASAQEYWAEATQSWFNANLRADPPNGIHGPIDTRDALRLSDPDMAAFLEGFFPDDSWLVP